MTEDTAPAPSITRTEGVCGGAACLDGTRIPVWVFAIYREMLGSSALGIILSAHPNLTESDVEAAWAYADANVEETWQDYADNREGAGD